MKISQEAKRLSNQEKAQSLEYLMRRFGDKVLRIAYYYVRDKYQAEDIAQEVFCKVYENLEKFRNESSYYTWIYRITVNKCHDYLTSATFRRIFLLDNIKKLNRIKKIERHPFEVIDNKDIFHKVMELPLKYRIVIVMYYFEELSTVEISKILKIKESTVRTRLCRAREKLKKLLSNSREDYI